MVRGHVGNLKVPYFENPEVQRILREKYGLVVDVEGMATQEMLCPSDPSTLDGVDFLLAGELSQVASYEALPAARGPVQGRLSLTDGDLFLGGHHRRTGQYRGG